MCQLTFTFVGVCVIVDLCCCEQIFVNVCFFVGGGEGRDRYTLGVGIYFL